jgi:hypothetical protein
VALFFVASAFPNDFFGLERMLSGFGMLDLYTEI